MRWKKYLGEYHVLFFLLSPIGSNFLTRAAFTTVSLYGKEFNLVNFSSLSFKNLNTPCQNFISSNLKGKSKTRVSIESLDYNQNAYYSTFLSNFTSEINSFFLRQRRHFIAKYFQIEYTEILTRYPKKWQVAWFMYWTYVTKIEKLMKIIKCLRNQKIPLNSYPRVWFPAKL